MAVEGVQQEKGGCSRERWEDKSEAQKEKRGKEKREEEDTLGKGGFGEVREQEPGFF